SPKHPVFTTPTSSARPFAAISFSSRSMILWLPEEVHPVPPQTSTCERYIAFPPFLFQSVLNGAQCVFCDHLASQQMHAEHLQCFLGRHLYIRHLLFARFHYFHARFILAQSDASCLCHTDLLRQILLVHRVG